MHYLFLTQRFLAIALLLTAWAPPAQAQVAFGDDSSSWAFDGECDDPRFIGEGMAGVLLEEDRLADATDCRLLFDTGYIRLRAGNASITGAIDFGADTSEWIRDGECDDPRFVGEGMAAMLLEEDRLADATDCRMLFEAGRIRLRADGGKSLARGGVASLALQPEVGEYGYLEGGDDLLEAGEYCDHFTFEGRAGAFAVIELRSETFDPYLIVRAPSGEQLENDDFEGDASRSVVAFRIQESGTYTVGVTSYQALETGLYGLLLEIQADTPTSDHGQQFRELAVRAVAPDIDARMLIADYYAAASPSSSLH
jgi:hypothetical protein